jgi:HAD superfamily hydrolase (TIGR01509 family)
MIRAVVLDIGGVLEVIDEAGFPAPFLRRHGLAPDALAAVELPGDPALGELTEDEVRTAWASGLGLDEAAADELMAEYWRWYTGAVDPVLLAWFARQRPALQTGILSNSGPGAREAERRWGFEDVTDVLVYSHEIGVAKPDPRAFAVTTERLGVEPGEVVFLDDVQGHVEAARRFGWHAVVHRGTPASIAAIERLVADLARRRRH